MPEPSFDADPAPATPIGHLRTWILDIQCGQCRRHVVVPIPALIERYGEGVGGADLIRRLRCSGVSDGRVCTGAPKRVILAKISLYGSTHQRVREIVVIDRPRKRMAW